MIYVPFMRKDPVVLTMSAFLQKNIDLNALAIGEGVLLKNSYDESVCGAHSRVPCAQMHHAVRVIPCDAKAE